MMTDPRMRRVYALLAREGEEIFNVDGKKVRCPRVGVYTMNGPIAHAAAVAEDMTGKTLHHRNHIYEILHRHYFCWSLSKIHLYKAEWAYDGSNTGYITTRQLVKVLKGIPRDRCDICHRKAQHFDRDFIGERYIGITTRPKWLFCSEACQTRAYKEFERLEIKEKKDKQWLRKGQQTMKEIRKFLNGPPPSVSRKKASPRATTLRTL